ncbi:alpha/beta hydrolase [Candidatus Babeliales bacterium]|nr:alpha/beta hydrolase [Candidatus Babeliales bacterium]
MATIILVHGAFQGDWVWDKITPTLRAAGHTVYSPTLQGLGSRASELTQQTGLQDHIADVCKVIDENNASEIILLGHSYGGIVISGVAKVRTLHIKKILYLDAPIPDNNQSLLDVLGADTAQFFYNSAHEGWRIDSFPAQAFGLDKEKDIAWAFPQHTPQSLKTFTDKVSMLQPSEMSSIKIGYILCTPGNVFTQTQALKAQKQGWDTHQIQAGHCPMITDAKAFADLLCKSIL